LGRAWKYGDTLGPLYYPFPHCLVGSDMSSPPTLADAAGRFAVRLFMSLTQADQQHQHGPHCHHLA
jgi:hypothetical protein